MMCEHAEGGVREDDAGRRPHARGQSLQGTEKPVDGAHRRRHRLLPRPRHRRGARQGQRRQSVLEALLRRHIRRARVAREDQARRRHPRLQRSRQRAFARADPDVRARHRGGVPGRRRRLRPTPGADGERPSETRLAPGREPDPRRVRHDHRQRDAGGSRPHGAAVGHLRPADGVAVQGDSAVRERDPVSAAHRRALLQARPGDPPRGRGFPGGPARRRLRHRRHVAPAAGRARRPREHGIRQDRSSTAWSNDPAEAHEDSRTRSTCAKPAPRASRW